ncbi:MAG TPA: GatB/YqeY domain-containing protein [Gemmatimonadaceae bacterium]
MSELIARLQADLNASRKAQDKAGTLLLGTILADIKNRRIELMRDLTDDDARDVLRKGIKRRREAIEMYDKAARTDLASREREEVRRLESYLPANVGDDEIRAAVRAAIASGATTIGALMGKVMPQFKGRADGTAINRIAREELPK